jgi:hypothetical protein
VGIYVHTSILSIAQEKMNQWFAENNLAHLLEHTPGLKTLNVVANDAESGLVVPERFRFGLTHPHPCMLKLQMG